MSVNHNEVREILLKRIQNDFPEDRVCLLLSGGTDSTVLGLVCRELGKDVVTVSFELDGYPNWDCETSDRTSEILGFEFHKVVVPTNDPSVDFLNLIHNYKCETKIELEIIFPFLHILRKVKELGFTKVLTGFSSMIPDSRKSNVEHRKDQQLYWEQCLVEEYDSKGTQKSFEVSSQFGITLYQPLTDKDLIRYLSSIPSDQLHKPYWKSPYKLPYKDDFEMIGLLEKGKTPGLQVGGGVENYFSQILGDPIINYRGYLRGNDTQRLSQLVKLWISNPTPTGPPYPIIHRFKPYTMDDVRRQSDKKLFNVVTTFSGGGGSSTGYKLGGGDILLMNEFIPEGVKTYLTNYPNTPYEMVDIRKITRRGGREYVVEFFKKYNIEVGQIDILDGSPPCSTFSTSGKGKEKIEQRNVKYSDTTQDRIGMLIHDFVYINNCMKPKICVIENVPSIQSSDVFKQSLERLRRWGYKVNFNVMCSSNFGVPQRRRRLIVVGIRPDVCKVVGIKKESQILDLYPRGSVYEPTVEEGLRGVNLDPFERKQLLLSTVKSSTYELIKSIPKNPNETMKISDLDPTWTSDFNLVRSSLKRPVPTLTQMGQQMGRGGVFHPSEDRVFTVDELKRLMGLPDDYILTGTFNQKSERCGRMVTPPIYKHLSQSLYENVLKPFKESGVEWEGVNL